MATNAKTTKTDDKPKAKEQDPQPTEAQKSALEPVDKSETRLFQTGAATPDGREALTKEEARARGFHWLDTDEPKGKKG